MAFEGLLRWFPRFRAIETERDQLRESVVSLQNEKIRLEDRLVAAQQDRDRLWESFQQSLQGERTAYQLHVNASFQRMGGGVPYPDAPHIPEHLVPTPSTEPMGRRGRVLMSEVLRQMTDRNLNQRLQRVEAE